LMQSIISGHDAHDATSLADKVPEYNETGCKGLKIGVSSLGDGIDESVKKQVWDFVKSLESQGASYEEVELPLNMKYGIQTYYILATTEASTNLAKLCGMRYGKHDTLNGSFNEYFSKVRGENFGAEAKRRIIIGTFARMAGFREAYYIKAAKVRTLLIQEYKKAFKKYDAIITPTMPILPPKFSEIEKLSPLQNYMMDILTVGANLAGMPHINVPVGMSNGLPVGAMITCDHLKEGMTIRLARCNSQKTQ